MIEALAVVVKVEDYHIWVEATQNSACSGCVQQTTCSTNALSSRLKKKSVPVDSVIKLAIGEQVLIGVDEKLLLRASLLLYLLPIIALFTGAGLSDWLMAGLPDADLVTAASGFVSFLLCLWCINVAQSRLILNYYARPVVIDKV